MNRTRISLIIAATFASSLLAASASAQNTSPPPGNVNPGSLNSGAEESGSEDQPRSGRSYQGTRDDYGNSGPASPYGAYDNMPALGYGPSEQRMQRGAPVFGGGYDD